MMDKELIEMAKLADMSILDEGLGAYTIYGDLKRFKEFHRLATEKAVREALEWQPIATAPKDKEILLRSKKGNIANGTYKFSNPPAWIWPYIYAEPIEWMPLPSPIRAIIPAGEKS
jgi:hypothetical protein